MNDPTFNETSRASGYDEDSWQFGIRQASSSRAMWEAIMCSAELAHSQVSHKQHRLCVPTRFTSRDVYLL